LRIVADDRRHADLLPGRDRPTKLSHIVLNSEDRAVMADFYDRALGFRVIDRTAGMTFLNCGSDHHSIAFAADVSRAVNHIAFEMPDIESVMRGAGRLRDHGYPIEWGVGRHGPGNNVFAYFLGPNGEVIEYTADVQQVDDSYRPGSPEDWTWPPGRGDHWGIAVGPTDRMKAAQRKLTFADELPPA
jgi:catechol 2,3-dioxygenase